MRRSISFRRTTAVTAAAVVMLLLSACSPGQAEETADGPIKLGATATITGPFAGACTEQIAGAQAWFDSVNAAGGINGREIEWDVLDDAGDPQRGVSNVRRLLGADTTALFDNCGSAGTVASLPEVKRAGIPNLFVNSVSDAILRPTPPTTYTLMPLYDQQLAALIPHVMKKDGFGTAALVYLDGFSKNILPGVEWAVTEAGGKLVTSIPVPADTNNWGPTVIQLKAANPDYVIIAGTTPGSGQLLAEMGKQNFSPAKGVIGSYSMADQIFLDFAGETTEDISLVSPVVPASHSAAEACNATLPEGQEAGMYTLLGCVSAQAMVAALEAAGDDLTSENILAALERLSPEAAPQLAGLQYSDTHLLNDSLYVWRVADGGFQLSQEDAISVPDSSQWITD
jgi:branched-chain amino acid transport system substrate-binding protein